MCDQTYLDSGSYAPLPPAPSSREERNGKPRRTRLYQMDHWCCSIVGTCLTHEDLITVARRRKIDLGEDPKMFEVHGLFVGQASTQNAVSKALEKLLDQRYQGMVRRVARLRAPEDLTALWESAVNSGQVAGAYWALLSHAHVPEGLRNRIFGEVHMMSHLMGGSARKIVGAAAELQARLDRMERLHRRWAGKARVALETRDAEIVELKQSLAEARARAEEAARRSSETGEADGRRAAQLLLKRERALIGARSRSRQLEAELVAARERAVRLLSEKRRSSTTPAAEHLAPPAGLCGRAVLYLGGRKDAHLQLRREAASANITLHCHDGGLDHSTRKIGDLVEKCDAVICPVTCINHQACLAAKKLCKRLNKPFLPIGSAGRGTFARALSELAGQLAEAEAAAR